VLDYILAACGVPAGVVVRGTIARGNGEPRINFLAKASCGALRCSSRGFFGLDLKPRPPESGLERQRRPHSGDPSYLGVLDYILAACGVPAGVVVRGTIARGNGEPGINFLAKASCGALRCCLSGLWGAL
jgi:hypothetical protein